MFFNIFSEILCKKELSTRWSNQLGKIIFTVVNLPSPLPLINETLSSNVQLLEHTLTVIFVLFLSDMNNHYAASVSPEGVAMPRFILSPGQQQQLADIFHLKQQQEMQQQLLYQNFQHQLQALQQQQQHELQVWVIRILFVLLYFFLIQS